MLFISYGDFSNDTTSVFGLRVVIDAISEKCSPLQDRLYKSSNCEKSLAICFFT